ncbi:MAG: HNH endonuclease [Bacteroidia bacterium]|jgi:hypothetical protein
MWKAILPENKNSLSELDTALTNQNGHKKYNLNASERKIIAGIYKNYETLKGVAHEDLEGNDLSKKTKEVIRDLYGEVQEKGRLNSLRSRLLLEVNRCPCCSISVADELDHHLPRSKYSPIAIYSSNLVPICHKCNNKKRTLAGEDPNERFIHVYYDQVPENNQFLKMDHAIERDTLIFNFYVEKVEGLTDLMFEQISFQIERVNLNKRLKKEVNTFLSSFAVGMKIAYGDERKENVKRFLSENGKYFEAKFGLNDWRTVLLYKLAECDIFCDGAFSRIL